jgi:hypothetical protein
VNHETHETHELGTELEGVLLSEPISVESEEGLSRANTGIISFPLVYFVYFVVIKDRLYCPLASIREIRVKTLPFYPCPSVVKKSFA